MNRMARLLLGTVGIALAVQPAALPAQRQPNVSGDGAGEPVRPSREPKRQPAAPSGSASASAGASTGAAATKRTWDFFKRLQVPRFTPQTGDCREAVAAFEQQLAAFRAYVDDGLAQPLEPKKLQSERAAALRKLPALEREADTWLTDLEAMGTHRPDGAMGTAEGDFCTVQYQRMNLMALRDLLRAMARIWPDLAEVQPVLRKVEAGLAKFGDEKAVEQRIAANRRDSIAQVRMKPAAAHNPVWEAELRSAFTRLRPGETVLKINLYSAGWYVKKNELTSVPEYRQYGGWVGARLPDGSCRLYSLDAFQTYQGGGSYGPSDYRIDSTSGREILCENI